MNKLWLLVPLAAAAGTALWLTRPTSVPTVRPSTVRPSTVATTVEPPPATQIVRPPPTVPVEKSEVARSEGPYQPPMVERGDEDPVRPRIYGLTPEETQKVVAQHIRPPGHDKAWRRSHSLRKWKREHPGVRMPPRH